MNEDEFPNINPLFNPKHSDSSTISAFNIVIQRSDCEEIQQLKSENNSLRKKIHELETESKVKDQLLQEKSTRIITCNSTNLRLKFQITALKKQLYLLRQHKSRKTKRNKKLMKYNSLYLAKSSSYEASSEDEDQMVPYLVPQISISMSASSNISDQACKLSFPQMKDANEALFATKPPLINILSPIAEHPNDESGSLSMHLFQPQVIADEKDKNKPKQQLEISNNNDNISAEEWGDCMASLDADDDDDDDDDGIDPNHLNVYDVHAKYNHDYHLALQIQSEEESSASPSASFLSNVSNETEKLLEKNIRSNEAMFSNSEEDSDDIVSYMTDNTMLLNDMNSGYQGFGGNKDGNIEFSQRSTQIYDEYGKNGSKCDVFIKSPLNLLDAQKDSNLNL